MWFQQLRGSGLYFLKIFQTLDFYLKLVEMSSGDKHKSWYSLMARSLWKEDKNVKNKIS